MSSLLEQAIVDASALKEAAIKNAESAILSKYSTDIKEAVENLLEQEEEFDISGEDTSASISSSLEDNIPLAGSADETASDSEIVLSMEELKEMSEALAEIDEELVGDASSHEDVADDVSTGVPSRSEEDEISSVSVDATLEEEIDLDIADLDEILEELVVDIHPEKEGWAGTPEDIMNYKEEMELARRSATQAKEQVKALIDAGERLSEENKTLKEKSAKMIMALKTFKENIEKVNLSNARLIYTNRILVDTSLNERQKSKIVDTLSKSDSIEEAKVIFETLKGAVGSVTGRAQPQSLRETIERPSATLPRKAKRSKDTPVVDRMQILAGIKKNRQP